MIATSYVDFAKGLLLNDEFILQIDGINSLKHTESFIGGRVLVTVVPLGSLKLWLQPSFVFVRVRRSGVVIVDG